ncbi:hypothetical protein acdb102_31300 [Acidothermaceae bacterium B102]|nr:hypothetical protein acdb102_31300 [Acidothermaceae bacterium B102]
MATVPAPITFVATTVLTAAQMNTNVRDSVNFLVAPPSFVGRSTTGMSTTSGAWTAMTLDTELLDGDNAHSTTTNTARFTANTTGWYLVTANCEFVANSTGGRQIRITVNGTSTLASGSVPASTAYAVNCSTMLRLVVGDFVQAEVLQSSGGSLALATTPAIGDNRVSVQWVHA